MTCKDCIHWKACKETAYQYNGEVSASGFDEDSCCKAFAEICENYSNKSEWVHLSYKEAGTSYYPVGYGNNARIIEEPLREWGVKDNKLYVIDECGDLYEVGTEVFLSREEAGKALAERIKK